MENNILSLLDKQERQLVSVRSYNKNDVLHREGDKCEEITIVSEGKIKIVSYSFSGKEIIFNELGKNQIF